METGIIGAFNELRPASRPIQPPETALRLPRASRSGFPGERAGAPEAVEFSLHAQASLARFTSYILLLAGTRSSLAHEAGPLPGVIDRTALEALWPSGGLQIRVADETKVIDFLSVQASPEVVQPEYFEVSAIVDLPIAHVLQRGEAINLRRPQAGGGLESQSAPYVSLVWTLIENDQISRARSMLNVLPEDARNQSQVRALSTVLAPPKVSTTKTTDVDRHKEYQWLKEHEDQYRAQWVAVDGDKLVLSAASLKELLEGLRRLNLGCRPLIHRFS